LPTFNRLTIWSNRDEPNCDDLFDLRGASLC
jgi:hypothetical protein